MSRAYSRINIQRFGEKVRTLRLKNKLTLQQFAESLGYSAHGYISELEAGKKTPTVEFVLTVSQVYGVSTDELLKDELNIRLSTSDNDREN
ncbi:MAG: helix-turn-helix domain-containing protein [Aggregatilineales bacterium]